MSEFTQAQRSFWDGFAVEHERCRESATSLVAATLHRQLRLARAASVLEVGTGAGAGALDLASHLPANARLVATDLSPAMLRLARAKLRERGSRGDPLRTLFFDAARALRIELPQPAARRTPFHLGRRERLTRLLEHAGFTSVVTWYLPSVEAVSDGASLAEDIVRTEVAARQLNRRSLRALQKKLAQLADERLASGRPIVLDVLMATARKPEHTLIQRHASSRGKR